MAAVFGTLDVVGFFSVLFATKKKRPLFAKALGVHIAKHEVTVTRN